MKKMTTIIFMALAFFTIILKVQSTEFQVNGDQGWTIPPNNDTEHFNQWASHNRFKINDTLHFVYKHNSVMVVTKEEHKECVISNRPIFVSLNGDTRFKLNRSGFFYFISGDAANCRRGLQMIIKVLEHSHDKSEAVSLLKMDSDVLSQTLIIVGIISMFTVFFM